MTAASDWAKNHLPTPPSPASKPVSPPAPEKIIVKPGEKYVGDTIASKYYSETKAGLESSNRPTVLTGTPNVSGVQAAAQREAIIQEQRLGIQQSLLQKQAQQQAISQAVVAQQRQQEAGGATAVSQWESMYNAPTYGVGKSIAEIQALQRAYKPEIPLELQEEIRARNASMPIQQTAIRVEPSRLSQSELEGMQLTEKQKTGIRMEQSTLPYIMSKSTYRRGEFEIIRPTGGVLAETRQGVITAGQNIIAPFTEAYKMGSQLRQVDVLGFKGENLYVQRRQILGEYFAKPQVQAGIGLGVVTAFPIVGALAAPSMIEDFIARPSVSKVAEYGAYGLALGGISKSGEGFFKSSLKSLAEIRFNRKMAKFEKSITGEPYQPYPTYEPRGINFWSGESSSLVKSSERGITPARRIIEVEPISRGIPVRDFTERQLQLIPKEIKPIEVMSKPDITSGGEIIRIVKSGKYPKIIETTVQQKLAGEPFILKTEKGVKVIKQGLMPEIKKYSPSFENILESGQRKTSIKPTTQLSLIQSIPLEAYAKRNIAGLIEYKARPNIFNSKKASINAGSILGTNFFIPLEIKPEDIFAKFDEGRSIKSEEKIKPFEENIFKTKEIKVSREEIPIIVSPRVSQISKSAIGNILKQSALSKQAIKPVLDIEAAQKPKTALDVAQIPKIKVATLQKQAQKQIAIQQQKSELIKLEKPIQELFEEKRTKEPEKPKEPFDFIPKEEPKKNKLIIKKQEFLPKKKSYRVELRRRGKFLGIGKFGTSKEAFIAGLGKVKSTLGVSTRVIEEETGSIVNPREAGIGFNPKQFYLSKKEFGVIIQARGSRLGTKSEIFEIKKAKMEANIFKRGKAKWL